MQETRHEIKSITGKRIIATLIDYTFLFAATIFYIMAFGEPNDEGGKSISGFPALVPIIAWFLWFVVVEAKWGQTLGLALVGLKVVSDKGGELSFGQVFKRRLCDTIEISWCFGLIAFLIVKNNKTEQRLGDMVAKVKVVPSNYSSEQLEFEHTELASKSSR